MTRLFLAATALAALSVSSVAEETPVRLVVRPMAGPKPAMKYQLLPELSELNPGNAAQNYLKCFAEQRYFFFSQQGIDERTRFQRMPLAELALAHGGTYGGGVLNRADWAARMDYLDWQSSQIIQNGDINLLPGEMGPLQVLASSLQVRFRGAVAEQHFDDAIRTAKTMFALARDLGEHPTVVANLVGLWTARLGLETLEAMVQQPACPNLYWALTDLPSPLVGLRKGPQGDQILVARQLGLIHSDGPMTETELEKLVSRLSGLLAFSREQSGQPPRSFRATLQAITKDPAKIRAARERLVGAGSKEDEVKKLTPLQVILLDQKREYEVDRDERLKLLGLPLWQFEGLAGAPERDRSSDAPLADLLPDVIKLRREQGAFEQQVAILRHVEALRMYAAEHGGKLPEKLPDIPVPLPPDPTTGKPFVYSVDGTMAHISGRSNRSESQGPAQTVRYSVTIQK
jgi:hypothetical protein